MRKCKILIPIGCRSDEGLIKPIINKLEKKDWCEVKTFPLSPAYFAESYTDIELFCRTMKPDLMICVADRIEMCAAACAAFHNNIPIGHVYAGILNHPISTLDDVNRHVITLYADLAFCEDKQSCLVVEYLWNLIKKEKDQKVYMTGITHMDDVEVDESLVPDEPYDLILFNPITIGKVDKNSLSLDILNRKTIWIGPNPDRKDEDWDINMKILSQELDDKEIPVYYNNLPRSQFLGLMKNCERYITNSSSAYYEAPFFLKPEQIIQVGLRNKNRSTPKRLKTGASDKIVKILKEWWENEDNS